jgi:putative alpha-1,2-mannosidase
LADHFKNAPDGLPGNDDTGTMSAWAVFSMMGFYPDNATDASYTFTTPLFDRITLQPGKHASTTSRLEIEVVRPTAEAQFIDKIVIDGRRWRSYRISHAELIKAKKIVFHLKERK